jgi:hypothetical protein
MAFRIDSYETLQKKADGLFIHLGKVTKGVIKLARPSN